MGCIRKVPRKQLRSFMLTALLLSAVISPLFAANRTAEEDRLDRAFCVNCHIKEVDDIEDEGLAHGVEIDCSDCHAGHKPRNFENIPHCNQCHSGTSHYDQLQCLNCHNNPHRPLQIKLPKKAHAECLTCHDTPGNELLQFPSYHSSLVCTDCHHEHGELPECMSCHRSHDTVMTEDNCQACHAPHKPLELAYADNLPTAFCAPCHAAAANLMLKTRSKHAQLSCVKCHMVRHAAIPTCRECHEEPHAAPLHKKFPNCGECHNSAHDLD